MQSWFVLSYTVKRWRKRRNRRAINPSFWNKSTGPRRRQPPQPNRYRCDASTSLYSADTQPVQNISTQRITALLTLACLPYHINPALPSSTTPYHPHLPLPLSLPLPLPLLPSSSSPSPSPTTPTSLNPIFTTTDPSAPKLTPPPTGVEAFAPVPGTLQCNPGTLANFTVLELWTEAPFDAVDVTVTFLNPLLTTSTISALLLCTVALRAE